jgi:hypothetical protein
MTEGARKTYCNDHVPEPECWKLPKALSGPMLGPGRSSRSRQRGERWNMKNKALLGGICIFIYI